jgi:hypothetical protein
MREKSPKVFGEMENAGIYKVYKVSELILYFPPLFESLNFLTFCGPWK